MLGDVHGSFHALLRNLCHMRQLGHLDEDFRLHPRVMLVCLGDYVDYGPYGVEVLWTLLWLQLRNRRQVVLLGGNHEDVGQNQVSGGMPDNFALELNVRFSGAWPRMAPLLDTASYRTVDGVRVATPVLENALRERFPSDALAEVLRRHGLLTQQAARLRVQRDESTLRASRRLVLAAGLTVVWSATDPGPLLVLAAAAVVWAAVVAVRAEARAERWSRVLKHAHSDRKLLGGLLLDFARHKDRVGSAVASDRLFSELCRVILEATATAVEEGLLEVVPAERDPEPD